MLNASVKAPEPLPQDAAPGGPKPLISDFITVIARLSQLLAEEAEAIDRLQLRKVGEMQEEKLRLIAMLDKCKKYYDKFPGELETLSAADREDMQSVVAVFNNILQQNFRRVTIARELSRKMVEAIREAVKDASANKLYNGKGMASLAQYDHFPVSLNQVI
jgi:hypothetical protein